MIKQNEGSTDRGIRIVIGIIALASGLFWLTGIAQIVAIVIGAVALITGIVGFCGLYTIFGISTCPLKKK